MIEGCLVQNPTMVPLIMNQDLNRKRYIVFNKLYSTMNKPFFGVFFVFVLNFWRTHFLFVGPLIPLFRTYGDVCPGFQSQGGLACMAML